MSDKEVADALQKLALEARTLERHLRCLLRSDLPETLVCANGIEGTITQLEGLGRAMDTLAQLAAAE
ncbi:MAG: hypothetical protein HYS61_03550 [Acidobacteria bacterium]|nr:hypothetical protein [Acidobacteriota bacterium]